MSGLPEDLPRFQLPHYAQRALYGAMGIETNHELYHRLDNCEALYAALGYGREAAEAGLLPDEFIWAHYHSPGAPKNADCIQSLIATFLLHHSERFRMEYGTASLKRQGRCTLHAAMRTGLCIHCPRHPQFTFQSESNEAESGGESGAEYAPRPG